jgi:site-specific DNA-methyltransferase (adenine-specific)
MDAIKQLCDDGHVSLLQTDPPYGVAYQGQTNEKLEIKNDNISEKDFAAFLENSFKAASSVMKKAAGFYIWHSENMRKALECALTSASLEVKEVLVWVKSAATFGRQDYRWQHESCLYGWKEGDAHYFTFDRTQTTVVDYEEKELRKMSKSKLRQLVLKLKEEVTATTVFREEKPNKNLDHPTMKPIKLIQRQIANSTMRGDKVLDIFAGSGTTLIACEKLGRIARVCELDPKYADRIIKRWEKMTKKKAVLCKT